MKVLSQAPAFDGEPTAEDAVLAGLPVWQAAKERHDELTARVARGEDVLGELDRATEALLREGGWDRSAEIREILAHVGIGDPSRRVSAMSGGERRRVALAEALVAAPDLLVLDEPTNHLDVETIEWLETYLEESFRGAVLLVTHDRALLDRVVDATWEIAGGALYAYEGGWGLYLEAKAERLAHAARTEANRQNFLRRELEWLRRQPKARTTKQKARILRANEARSAAPPVAERAVSFDATASRSGKTIAELRGVTLARGGRTLVKGLDLFLVQGEVIGIVGQNGTGKSSLLAALAGELAPVEGELTIGQNTRIALFDQERRGLDPEKSVFDNVAGEQAEVRVGGDVLAARSYLTRFGFEPDEQKQKVASLSGGERARVALAKLLRQPANLLLLDEPTNDLDVDTLSAIEAMIADFPGTVMVVTHDRWFLDRVATSVLAFLGDGVVKKYGGGYEAYRRARDEARLARLREEREAQEGARRASPTQGKAAGLTSNERYELDALFELVAAAEEALAETERALEDPGVWTDGRGAALTAELDRKRAEVARLTARWEELEAKR